MKTIFQKWNKRSQAVFSVCLIIFVLLSCKPKYPNADESTTHTASSVVGPEDQKITETLMEVQKRFPELLTITTYGESVEGRPLVLLVLAKTLPKIEAEKRLSETANSESARPAILLTQTVHGNEYLGIVDNLANEFLTYPNEYQKITKFVDAGGIVFMIPFVNPDGYAANMRVNKTGLDLNRDFKVDRYTTRLAAAEQGKIQYSEKELELLKKYVATEKFSQPETKALANVVQAKLKELNGKLKLFIDYHCCQSPEIGSLMPAWGDSKSLKDGSISEFDVSRIENVFDIFKFHFPDHLTGTGYEIIKYLTFGTIDEWFYETFANDGVLVFCYEGKSGGDENKKLGAHAAFLNRLVSEKTITGLQ